MKSAAAVLGNTAAAPIKRMEAIPFTETKRLPLHRGMSFGYLARRGYYATREACLQVERMAELGVDSVALMVSVMQDSFSSTRLYRDFEFTVTDHELSRIIDRFHEHGIRVMLKPMVECQDSSWRGAINFPDNNQQIQGRVTRYWDQWFESFKQSVLYYADFAQWTGCEYYCLGCELQSAEQRLHNERWEDILGSTREIYKGTVCYDAMPGTLLREQGPPEWMKLLDAVCISYYNRAADAPGASVEAMMEFMAPTVGRLRAVSESLGMRVIFGETGCRSLKGGAVNPSEYRTVGAYDPQEQANYLEALCRTFWNESWWGGLYWWKWDEQQQRTHYLEDPAGDTGFTLAGKPAAKVMQRWFSAK